MREETVRLFDEFAAAYAAGDDPDLRAFLARAGDDLPAFAQLVDRFLAGSDPPPVSEERLSLMRGWMGGDPPLLKLRKERALKRGEVVARLTRLLGLSPDREPKVLRYYHRVEGGLLDSRGVDQRVWAALAEIFGRDVRELADWRWVAPTRQLAYRFAEMPVPGDYVPAEPPAEDDEVDRLFLSGA